MLYGAERLRRRKIDNESPRSAAEADRKIAEHISWPQSVKIGFLQVISLLPGFSRTGSTITGGLLSGLSHEDALRFSFLLATPIIGAAALLKLPPLLVSGDAASVEVALVGAIAAGIAAYFSARFLARYFKTKTLTPFAIYCIALGALSMLILR